VVASVGAAPRDAFSVSTTGSAVHQLRFLRRVRAVDLQDDAAFRADLADAVRRATDAAEPGEVVLLSPACASFDAFENFEQRGERFREIVEGLR